MKSSSIFKGMGKVLDLCGVHSSYHGARYDQSSGYMGYMDDASALSSDWHAVGKDLEFGFHFQLDDGQKGSKQEAVK